MNRTVCFIVAVVAFALALALLLVDKGIKSTVIFEIFAVGGLALSAGHLFSAEL